MMEREESTTTSAEEPVAETDERRSESTAEEPVAETDEQRSESTAEEPVAETDERRPTTADIATSRDDLGEEAPPRTDDVDDDEGRNPLLEEEATVEVRGRWEKIQGGFVDEPRRAVEEADTLVAELMQRLADSFAEERKGLEGQWDRGDEVSTEDLRIALQRYRSFFDRLLSV